MDNKPQYRYPGPKSFSRNETNLFFGRSQDSEKLYQLIKLEKTVVLFSKSGLGKSSLINAGITPLIERDKDYGLLSIRLWSSTGQSAISPSETTKKHLTDHSSPSSWFDKLSITNDSIWFFLKRHLFNHQHKKGLILVFDQFEELFTYTDQQIDEFQKNLSELFSGNVPQAYINRFNLLQDDEHTALTDEQAETFFKPIEAKVVFSIREDKLSLMSRLTNRIPDILSNCYELKALSTEQAEDAILLPSCYSKKDEIFHSQAFDYTDETLDYILNFLSKNKQQSIESFQLQVLCQFIETKVISESIRLVSKEMLGDISSIYTSFYDKIITSIPENEREKVQILIEEGLIFEEEQRRLSLSEKQIEVKYEISRDLLYRLIDTHLIRAEINANNLNQFELAHDTLVIPILHSKAQRLEQKRIAEEKELINQKQQRAIIDAAAKQKQKLQKTIRLFTAIILAISIGSAVTFYIQAQRLKEATTTIAKAYMNLNELVQADSSIRQGMPLDSLTQKALAGMKSFKTGLKRFQKIKLDFQKAIKNPDLQKERERILQIASEYDQTLTELYKSELLKAEDKNLEADQKTDPIQNEPKTVTTKQDEKLSDVLANAIKLFDNKKYNEALPLFRQCKDKLYEANYYLGLAAEKGLGTTVSEKESCTEFKSASAHKIEKAHYKYAYCLFKGIGTEKDLDAAMNLLMKVKKQAEAQTLIGTIYYSQFNFKEALAWFIKGAEGGNINAMGNLVDMYSKGTGIPQNAAEADKWKKKIADSK